MAYDEGLVERVRECLGAERGLQEKKMFGGVCFLLHGNMACGVVGDELCVRVGPHAYAQALTQPHAREMDFTGKPLKGMVYVAPAGLRPTRALRAWVERGASFARGLPKKTAAKKAAAKKTAAKKAAAKKTAAKKAAGQKAAAKKTAVGGRGLRGEC